MPLSEVHEDRWTVIADRSEAKALLFESFFCILQLHELRFAKGSPICGTEEKDNRAFWTFQCFVGLFVTELIDEGELWRSLADL